MRHINTIEIIGDGLRGRRGTRRPSHVADLWCEICVVKIHRNIFNRNNVRKYCSLTDKSDLTG